MRFTQQAGSILGRVIADLGGASMAPLIVIGDRLGLYRALAIGGPLTAGQLAARTGTDERYIREWLNAHAASGYVTYLPDQGLYQLTLEQAMVFADAGFVGGFQSALLAGQRVDALTNAFCSGQGIACTNQQSDLVEANANFNRISYQKHLLQDWIPAIPEVHSKLKAGILVVDVGCGPAYSTEILANAFPRSDFVGVDSQVASIGAATQRLQTSSARNIRLQLGHAHEFQGKNHELVTMFNALHDVGDPNAVARHVFMSLRPGGIWMIVEPFAGDRIEENLHPIGRVYYSRSALLNMPSSLAQDGRAALGAQAGEARLRAIVTSAGFKDFRRVAHTPWSMVFAARA